MAVLPPDPAVPGVHMIEYTDRRGFRRSAPLSWDPESATWRGFPDSTYDPDVLAESALRASYAGATEIKDLPLPIAAAIQKAATEGELRDAFYATYSRLCNAPADVQAHALVVLFHRMFRLTEAGR